MKLKGKINSKDTGKRSAIGVKIGLFQEGENISFGKAGGRIKIFILIFAPLDVNEVLLTLMETCFGEDDFHPSFLRFYRKVLVLISLLSLG